MARPPTHAATADALLVRGSASWKHLSVASLLHHGGATEEEVVSYASPGVKWRQSLVDLAPERGVLDVYFDLWPEHLRQRLGLGPLPAELAPPADTLLPGHRPWHQSWGRA